MRAVSLTFKEMQIIFKALDTEITSLQDQELDTKAINRLYKRFDTLIKWDIEDGKGTRER